MLSLYRPFTSLFRDDFVRDELADRGWNSFFYAGSPTRPAQSFAPAVDVIEQEKAYLLRAELPGVSPSEVDIQIENDVLTLRGERKHESQDERDGYRRVERSYGSFSRSFVLPKGTNVDAIEARADNGVLTVTIPKAAAATSRKVEVKAAGIVDKAKKIFAKNEETATA